MLSRRLIPLLIAALSACTAHAQAPATLSGSLLIWIVQPSAPVAPRVIAAAPLAGSMPDQTAGSYGQTLGSFGQTAGSYGQTAGSYGQTAGSFGQTAGSYGQTAGSYGQTLAGFGTSLDGLPAAAARANGGPILTSTKPSRSFAFEPFFRGSRLFEHVEILTQNIPANELEEKLLLSGNAGPDILLGSPLPAAWTRRADGLVRRYGLVTLTSLSREEQSEEPAARPAPRAQLSILLAAPHPETARAFVRLFLEARGCDRCPVPNPDTAEAIGVGSASLRDVLQGSHAGGVDPDFAEAEPAQTQALALGTGDRRLLDELSVQIAVISANANERFALLQLSATLESRAAFGVVQAMVVLRKDDQGKWRTLQVTPSLRVAQLAVVSKALIDYTQPVRLEQVGKPLGISQAAPVDGDVRPVQPYLAWENFGGATLQIVESQARVNAPASGWLGSNLFFIPDTTQHLRTEVSARFASHIGDYRWRVWSLGKGGSLTLSPWKTIHIVAQ